MPRSVRLSVRPSNVCRSKRSILWRPLLAASSGKRIAFVWCPSVCPLRVSPDINAVVDTRRYGVHSSDLQHAASVYVATRCTMVATVLLRAVFANMHFTFLHIEKNSFLTFFNWRKTCNLFSKSLIPNPSKWVHNFALVLSWIFSHFFVIIFYCHA